MMAFAVLKYIPSMPISKAAFSSLQPQRTCQKGKNGEAVYKQHWFDRAPKGRTAKISRTASGGQCRGYYCGGTVKGLYQKPEGRKYT